METVFGALMFASIFYLYAVMPALLFWIAYKRYAEHMEGRKRAEEAARVQADMQSKAIQYLLRINH